MKQLSLSGALELNCHLNQDHPEGPSVSIVLLNGLSETIHIFDSPRMPYFIRQEDGSLLVLFGVNPPDPEIDYGMIEIPLTRPLRSGESAEWLVNLTGFHFKDHYQVESEPANMHDPTLVIVQVGRGATAIGPKERFQTNINSLLEWQRLEECTAGEVEFV